MNPRPLNLLRHPRRLPTLAPGQGRALLVASAVGVVAACGWGLWQQMQQEQLWRERARLQHVLRTWREQQAQRAAAVQAARLQQQWVDRAQSWQLQGQRLVQLQAALVAQANQTGLRLERWQGDAQQLLLHAWVPRADVVSEVRDGLAQASATAWTLQSMGDGAQGGLVVVLQTSVTVPGQQSEQRRP